MFLPEVTRLPSTASKRRTLVAEDLALALEPKIKFFYCIIITRVLFFSVPARIRIILPYSDPYLKGVSSEKFGGSGIVSKNRYSSSDVVMAPFFFFKWRPAGIQPKTVNRK